MKLQWLFAIYIALIMSTQVRAVRGSTHTYSGIRYHITDIGSLGGDMSVATAINESGVIIGYSRTKSGRIHAMYWHADVIHDIETVGGRNSYATGINSRGVIVGNYSYSIHHFVRAFLWHYGYMKELRASKSIATSATGINDAGVVSGSYTTSPGTPKACVWNAVGVNDLPKQIASGSEANGVGPNGAVVGALIADTMDRSRACFWQRQSMIRLPVPASANASMANGINMRGIVVGSIEINGELYPCEWRHRNTWQLVLLPGSQGEAKAVNNVSDIVGCSDVLRHATHAVIWHKSKMLDLNNVIDDRHWLLEYSTGINDRGQIVGVGTHYGHHRGFVLTPTAVN